MTKLLDIHVLSDGKPGHENQSYGLAEAIGRIRPVRISKIALGEMKGPLSRFRHAWQESGTLPPPQLIIGAGHTVHPPLLALARKTGAPCVVMMKPTLPTALFDLCLVPEHDLGKKHAPDNVIATLGALNRVLPPGDQTRHEGLILLGGPSSSHGWDENAVLAAVKAIVASGKGRQWAATDSRRSPDGVLASLSGSIPGLAVFPHAGTGRDWLPRQLAGAAEVWVTEDSISMIYEALSSGAKVGLLPVPALKKAGRVARGIARLADEGFVTPFARWSPSAGLSEPPRILREADRCATIVLDTLLTE